MSVWSKEHNPETSVKRNTFPQSFLNNLTLNFGGIYPFFCCETLSGDTFEIDCAHALRFLPTYFPLQNRIRVDAHFFYVRSRNLYDEFKEFTTGGTVDKSMPFLSGLTPDFFKTGSLADYFNIPTVANYSPGDVVRHYTNIPIYYESLGYINNSNRPALSSPAAFYVNGSVIDTNNLVHTGDVVETKPKFGGLWSSDSDVSPFSVTPYGKTIYFPKFEIDSSFFGGSFLISPSYFPFLDFTHTRILPVLVASCSYVDDDDYYAIFPCGVVSDKVSALNGWQIPSNIMQSLEDGGYTNRETFSGVRFYLGYVLFSDSSSVVSLTKQTKSANYNLLSQGSFSADVSSLSPSLNPFINGKVPLNALPFRAYEQIYNAFFRDERNNPLIINGKPYYDKYLPTTAGGADTTKYVLHKRNWEQDFLTTALPSPQQGQAPLVGISSTGVMSISDSEGNVYQAQAITSDDADTIIGAKFIKTNQDGTSIPTEVARSLVSYATSGISINDFRNVNALQRYLETNLRRGLKYRDLISARWGVNISYSEMNMPEFIGGFTDYVNSAQVNQQSQGTSSDPLGSYAGQLFSQGKQKHKIRHFCDESGFIIGVISVVPVPVYSQLLPKMFTKFDQLDFFNPEFGHIGMQPIPMKEVAPVQVSLNSGNLDETFGYQRAWYDYLGRVDEVHGQFRGSLRDFVMYRTFSGIPRLSEDFLLVDNKPLDNVFSVQRDSDGNSIDKIFGQIYVDVVARRPIPRFGIPKLE